MTEEQLRALLRLKRFEQPPPGYYDQLLRDIHRRQRTELLRRPLWKIAVERVQTFFGEHSMSPASYAGAMATLAIFGVGVISIVSPNGAGNSGKSGAALAQIATIPVAAPQTSSHLRLQMPVSGEREVAGLDMPKNWSGSQPSQAVRHPRYVIDARPVSYEPTFSF